MVTTAKSIVALGFFVAMAGACANSEAPVEPVVDSPKERAVERVTEAPEPAVTVAPPNVLLITVDTQRADSFGIYGNPGGHTPNIDRLAEKSVVFERATAPMGTTFPSHASLFTGLYPRRHGVRYNGDRLGEEVETLAETLREAGWETMALVSYGSMVSRGGLGQGFVRTSHEQSGEHSVAASPVRVTGMARGLLSRKRPFPFFMWVHYFQPHSPYEPTPYSEEQLAGYDGPLAAGASVQQFYNLAKNEWRDEDRTAIRALYDGQTREADRTVGQILETLEKAGHAERTIVVITADHGQLLGEHDDVGHGFRLWEPVLHVPLLVYDPREGEPRRVSSRVGLVDVAPTILEMVGLSAPEAIDGRSLVPALRGEELEERPYFSEVRGLTPKKRARRPRDENALAVFLDDHKLVIQRGETKLYDLSADPSELAPLLETSDDPRARELAALAEVYRGQEDQTSGRVEPADLAPHVEEELRSLGYLQ